MNAGGIMVKAAGWYAIFLREAFEEAGDFRGIISRFHDRRDCGGSIRLLTPANETGIVLM
jgi:hypothetical protein